MKSCIKKNTISMPSMEYVLKLLNCSRSSCRTGRGWLLDTSAAKEAWPDLEDHVSEEEEEEEDDDQHSNADSPGCSQVQDARLLLVDL